MVCAVWPLVTGFSLKKISADFKENIESFCMFGCVLLRFSFRFFQGAEVP